MDALTKAASNYVAAEVALENARKAMERLCKAQKIKKRSVVFPEWTLCIEKHDHGNGRFSYYAFETFPR